MASDLGVTPKVAKTIIPNKVKDSSKKLTTPLNVKPTVETSTLALKSETLKSETTKVAKESVSEKSVLKVSFKKA